MSNESNVKFTTFGPHRGLSLKIGNFQFVDGACEVASILCRYHDVCYAHELEQKVAEYDTARENGLAATGEFPPATKLDEPAKPEPEPEKQPEPQAEPSAEPQSQTGEEQPATDAPQEAPAQQEETPQGESKPDTEAKKTQGSGKKNSSKQNQQ